MAEFSSYAAGTPSWIDLATTEVDHAKDFYSALFGWDYDVAPPEYGGYVSAKLRGKNVAGLMAMSPEMQSQGVPPTWTTYFASDDADATAKEISNAGGTIVVPVMDVGDMGRMLVAQDPTGAVFGVWQAGAHTGAQLANEPGTFVYSECVTRDVAAAGRFYASVFGHGLQEMEMGGVSYPMLAVGDHVIGNLSPMPDDAPDYLPSLWRTYFAVADTDRAAAVVRDNGGTVDGPEDMPYGRQATVQDAQGAQFRLIAVQDQSPS